MWQLLLGYTIESGPWLRRGALIGMELFGRISSKVLQERGGHEMLSVRLSKLVDLCQELVCSVRINKPEWAWTEQNSNTLQSITMDVSSWDSNQDLQTTALPPVPLLHTCNVGPNSYMADIVVWFCSGQQESTRFTTRCNQAGRRVC